MMVAHEQTASSWGMGGGLLLLPPHGAGRVGGSRGVLGRGSAAAVAGEVELAEEDEEGQRESSVDDSDVAVLRRGVDHRIRPEDDEGEELGDLQAGEVHLPPGLVAPRGLEVVVVHHHVHERIEQSRRVGLAARVVGDVEAPHEECTHMVVHVQERQLALSAAHNHDHGVDPLEDLGQVVQVQHLRHAKALLAGGDGTEPSGDGRLVEHFEDEVEVDEGHGGIVHQPNTPEVARRAGLVARGALGRRLLASGGVEKSGQHDDNDDVEKGGTEGLVELEERPPGGALVERASLEAIHQQPQVLHVFSGSNRLVEIGIELIFEILEIINQFIIVVFICFFN